MTTRITIEIEDEALDEAKLRRIVSSAVGMGGSVNVERGARPAGAPVLRDAT